MPTAISAFVTPTIRKNTCCRAPAHPGLIEADDIVTYRLDGDAIDAGDRRQQRQYDPRSHRERAPT